MTLEQNDSRSVLAGWERDCNVDMLPRLLQMPDSYRFLDVLPTHLREWARTNDMIAGTLSVIFNATLIGLAVTERNDILKRYSRLLLFTGLVDIAFAACSILISPQVEFSNGGIVFVMNGPIKLLPGKWHPLLLGIYTIVIVFAVNTTCITFIYRYLFIIRKMITIRRCMLFVIGVIFAIAVHQGILITVMLADDLEKAHGRCFDLLNLQIWRYGDRPLVCMMPSTRWTLYFATCASMITNVNYTIMIFVTIKLLQIFSRRSEIKISSKRYRLQQQMNCMLIIQMIGSVLSTVLPTAMFLSFPVFRLTIPGMGVLVMMAYAWVPLINPLTAIVFVSRFRNRFLQAICLRRLIKFQTSIGPITINTA